MRGAVIVNGLDFERWGRHGDDNIGSLNSAQSSGLVVALFTASAKSAGLLKGLKAYVSLNADTKHRNPATNLV